jgi:type IV pilus assembly protein PilC
MQFVCRLGTPDGRVIQEVHTASDEKALRRELERRGLHLFEARRSGLSFALPNFRRRRKAVSQGDFMIYNQELASLLKAGLPLLQALDMMLERMKPGRFQEVLSDIRNRVRSGEEMSDAFERYAEMFPRLYPASLKAGERSGELEAVLRRFVRYLKLVGDARKRVTSALVYPAVLVLMSIAMVGVLSLYVVPKFEDFFNTLEIELPLPTRITLGLSSFMTNNLLWVVLVVVAAAVFFQRWRKSDAGSYALDRFKLRVPLIGPILHRFALSEFSRSLATLLSGGIPLVPAFEIGTQAVGNSYVRRRLQPTIQKVREGKAFYQALEDSGVFTALAINLVKVGEETGALDEMLTNVSDFFDEQVETRLGRVLSLLEPLLMVFLGLVVAMLLLSIYLPLISSMGNSNV